MNKKIAIILLIVAMAVMFTACDGVNDNDNYYNDRINVNVFYSHAYINIGGDFVNVEISRWAFFSGRDVIQLELKDGTTLVIDAENCILYNGTLSTTNGSEATTSSETWEQRVIADACREMGIPTKGVKLQLTHSEFVKWLGCISYTYVMTTPDGTQYIVGARENEDGFYCDVEGKI